MKHTQGKWIVGTDKHSNHCVRLAKAPRAGYTDTIIAVPGDPTGKGCGEANAKLIAAAPELLAALEQLQEAFVHIPDDMKGNKYRSGIIKHCENMRVALNVARSAVNKATN